jgi:hypothetical protein
VYGVQEESVEAKYVIAVPHVPSTGVNFVAEQLTLLLAKYNSNTNDSHHLLMYDSASEGQTNVA